MQEVLQSLREGEREVTLKSAWPLKPKVSGISEHPLLRVNTLHNDQGIGGRKVWECGDINGLRKETWGYGKCLPFWSRKKQKSTTYHGPTNYCNWLSFPLSVCIALLPCVGSSGPKKDTALPSRVFLSSGEECRQTDDYIITKLEDAVNRGSHWGHLHSLGARGQVCWHFLLQLEWGWGERCYWHLVSRATAVTKHPAMHRRSSHSKEFLSGPDKKQGEGWELLLEWRGAEKDHSRRPWRVSTTSQTWALTPEGICQAMSIVDIWS